MDDWSPDTESTRPTASTMLLLKTLGELRLESVGEPSLSSRRKELVLLAYLARRGPRPFPRAEAAELLWEDRDERRARQSLRQALLELRRLVGDGLVVETDQLRLADGAVDLDANRFERELDAGQLAAAVARWKGDFLPGAEEVGGAELRSWLESEREGLRRRLGQALGELIEDARRRGAWREGVDWAERWTSALPLDQRAHLHLLQLLERNGRANEAQARFATIRTQLRSNELALSPELEHQGRLLEQSAPSAPRVGTNSAALFTPDLIGRGPALAELDAAWRQVLGGSSCLVLIEGEPGIGKTRLCEEFLRRLERESPRPVESRARARESSTPMPLGVLGQLVAGLAAAPGLSGAPAQALAVLAVIAPSIRQRFPTLPESIADPATVTEAFTEALAALAEEAATILFVDDLPQADGDSRRILLSLVERLPAGILLIATAPTGGEGPPLVLPQLPTVRRLKLQPLSVREIDLLVGSILELPADERQQLSARLHEHGGGNPLYIVELVSALAEEGTLAPNEQGSWHLLAGEGRLPLPSSVGGVIAWRLARLTPPARSLLEAAAALALPFNREALSEVTGDSLAAVEAALDELILHRLIRSVGNSGQLEFTHELVRRHVCQSVPIVRGVERVTRTVRRRRWRIGLAGAALAAIAAAAGLRLRPGLPAQPSAVAVLPFSVSGTKELGYLREGMVTLLSTELDGMGTLRSVDPRAVIGMTSQVDGDLSDVEQGRQVAERVGAGSYVTGSVVEIGGRIRIDATAYRRGQPGRPIARASVEGSTEKLFDLVDTVAGRLLSGLSGGPYEQLTRIAAITTSSLPALKDYLNGEALFRSGAFRPAARAFQQAVSQDSTFALAYYWLSVASWWSDDSRAADGAGSLAVRYGARLSERDRRLFQAWETFLRGDALEAERVYRGILSLEPENVEAWLQLGEVLFHSGPRRGAPLAAARQPFEQVVFFEPEHTSALLHLARIAASERHWDELDSLARRIQALSPSGEWAVEVRALRAFAEADLGGQEGVLADLKTADEGRVWNTARYVAVSARDLRGAGQLVALMTASTRPTQVRGFGHLGLAYLALAEGKLHTATEELDRAFRLDPVAALEYRALLALSPFVPAARDQLLALRDSLSQRPRSPAALAGETRGLTNLHDGVHPELRAYLIAGLSLRLEDTSAALPYIAELERPHGSAEASTVAGDGAGSLRAQLAQRAGHLEQAAAAMEEVERLEARVGLIGGSPFYSGGLERYLYAQMLVRLERFDDAMRWYSSFSSNSIFDLVYLAPSHLQRGLIAERLGRRDEAMEHYRQAIELWRDCDPELRPLIQEANLRLAQLTMGNSGRRP